MSGVLFIVNVPKKEHENDFKINNVNSHLSYEKEKHVKQWKVKNELNVKKIGTIVANSKNDVNVVFTNGRSMDYSLNNEALPTNKSDSTPEEGSFKSNIKTSWKEIIQVMKRKKGKFEITKPLRVVDILSEFHQDSPYETILSDVLSQLKIHNVTWHSTNNNTFWQVLFSMESGMLSEELLEVLQMFGIGSKYQSSISMLPGTLYQDKGDGSPKLKSENRWYKFNNEPYTKLPLSQVLRKVRANAVFTSDWLFMLLVAAFVTAIGLVENSTVILVASMLLSPLMWPIAAGTLGTAVHDRSLQKMGIKTTCLGLFLSLILGFVFGITICVIDHSYGIMDDWPTFEMISRCQYRSVWVGMLIAIPSGAGVALAVLGENTPSLAGVAVSASLLPPAVNTGLLWAMAVTRAIRSSTNTHWVIGRPKELAMLGTASLCLTFVNVICVYFSSITVFKVKEFIPLERKDISWWKLSQDNHQTKVQHQNNNNLNDNCDLNGDKNIERPTNLDKECQKKETPPELIVQSDTITFRKRPSIWHLRAQNITGCNEDSYERLDSKVDPFDALNKEEKKPDAKENDTLDNHDQTFTVNV